MVPSFDRSELVLGRLLGKGAYACVRELNGVVGGTNSGDRNGFTIDLRRVDGGVRRTERPEGRDDQEEGVAGRGARRDDEAPSWEPLSSPRLPRPNRGFVVKYLRSSKPHKRIVKDLTVEVDTLKSLRHHKHVVELHGVGHHFLVLERLVATLGDRIHRDWSATSILALSNGVIPGLRFESIDTTVNLERRLLRDRLLTAHDLAAAMEHLHSKR